MENIFLIKQRMQAAQDQQKSYADRKRKPMEFEVGDRVMLKKVAYKLELPQELSRVHHTFHVSNLKKCYADEPLVMPLEGIHVDDKLQFVEEPVEIMEREIKRLKRSRIPLVKVRWNSRRGPEFTWEREDSFKQKYPQLFTNRASSSTTRHVKRGWDTKIPQSSGPPIKVGDEAVHKELGDRMERAATTASSLEAEHDSDAQTRFETTFKKSNDPPLSIGYTLGSEEDSMKLLELMELCTKLSDLLQTLVDKKKVIITETSIRSDLHLEDAGGIDCLPTATIFEELARMGYEKPSQKLTFYKAFFSPQWKFLIHTITQCLSAKTTAWNEFSSTMASAIICLATNQKFNLSKYIFDAMVKHIEGGVKFLMYPRFVQVFLNKQLGDMSHHKKIYVNPSHTKKIFANMKREGKDFSGRVTPLFATMMVQANQEEGVDSGIPTNSQQTPFTTQPSSSRPQKKQSRRKQRKETEVPQDETHHDDSVPIPSNDPLLSGEDRMQLTELMILCTNLQKQVLDLEKAKDAQAKEIAGLKKRVQKLERKKKSTTTW
ncbi:hypothetical protein Tco_0792523 [Tanacetum coccineum]